ncbi:LysR family transcriptional regulator [Maritimibacter sp. DP07]|uniref:LysR family transcriptional regulator n=1 Tax=Maritimibacter harenae TaxID=2606218 RepID=A0A845LWD8_9RHOB|nr:LysR family transcriptional regulator [Maritimibacter harenae]MZR11666.1 LysR family transcriptional regulator [Maritimibacter harenae]
MDYGSLTEAANAMHLSQSALSYTLGRLRESFGDALFVQQGRGFVPTGRCIMLVPQVRRLLEDFEKLLKPRDFDPATSDRVIRICCNYYERAVLLPALIQRIRRSGANLRIEISTADTNGHLTLLDGHADILLSPIVADESGLMVRRLFAEEFVCFLKADDPRRDRLDMACYLPADQVVVDYEGWQSFYLTRLAQMGHQTTRVVSLPSFGAVRELISIGGFLITVPSRAAHLFEPECASRPLPFDAAFELQLFWPERDQADPFSIWLRNLVVESCMAIAA